MYYSNFVKKITECNQKFRTFPFRLSFALRRKQIVLLQDFVYLHIAIRPHIFSTYNDTRSIVERTSHSHIQHYFCRKHDVHERICLSIFFCKRYCNSCSFLLFCFYFKFYYPILNVIANHLYLLLLHLCNTNTKCDKKILVGWLIIKCGGRF